MHSSTQFSFGKQLLPELNLCSDCGSPAHAYLDGDNIGSCPEQPFVYICCDDCNKRISSGELLGNLAETPILDKLARVITIWNRKVYRPQVPVKTIHAASFPTRRRPAL